MKIIWQDEQGPSFEEGPSFVQKEALQEEGGETMEEETDEKMEEEITEETFS
jgi:hypothetical protein